MLRKKKNEQTSTIIAPDGSLGKTALMIAPITQPTIPSSMEQAIIRHITSVQNRDAAAGITIKAIIKIKPTA